MIRLFSFCCLFFVKYSFAQSGYASLTTYDNREISINLYNATDLDMFLVKYMDSGVIKITLVDENLNRLPASLLKYSQLKTFEIVAPNLAYLPDSIGQLTMLENLYCECESLSEFPFDITRLDALRELTIPFWNNRSFPTQIFSNLASLEVLYFNVERISNPIYIQSKSLKNITLQNVTCESIDLSNLTQVINSLFLGVEGNGKVNLLCKGISIERLTLTNVCMTKKLVRKIADIELLESLVIDTKQSNMPSNLNLLANIPKMEFTVSQNKFDADAILNLQVKLPNLVIYAK